jgi:hypothetical protein
MLIARDAEAWEPDLRKQIPVIPITDERLERGNTPRIDEASHARQGRPAMLKAKVLIVAALLIVASMTALSLLALRESSAKPDASVIGKPTPRHCSDQAWPYFSSDCLRHADGAVKEPRRVRIIGDPNTAASAGERARPASPPAKAGPSLTTTPAVAAADSPAEHRQGITPSAAARARPPNGLPPAHAVRRAR